MSGTVLFIQHHSYAPPAMLGEAFTEAGYDVEVLAISRHQIRNGRVSERSRL